jgi:periplasmic divalent cation tolerance protein
MANLLLSQRLAACITISSSVESHYWWKGKKEKGREFLLMIKTKGSLFKKAETAIRKNHSYSLPEILAIPITKGNQNYLNWLAAEVRS